MQPDEAFVDESTHAECNDSYRIVEHLFLFMLWLLDQISLKDVLFTFHPPLSKGNCLYIVTFYELFEDLALDELSEEQLLVRFHLVYHYHLILLSHEYVTLSSTLRVHWSTLTFFYDFREYSF